MAYACWARSGAIVMLAAVAAGAFGAHALKARLTPEMLAVWETAARYQAYHGLALLFLAWLSDRHPGAALTAGGWCFLAGTVIFSGSLYALALTEQRWLGAVTPLGGLLLLAGWACVALSPLR